MTDIVIEIDGVRYSYWKQISVTRSLEKFSGSFTFVVSGGINKTFPIKVGQKCRVKIDENSIINGFVELIEGTLDSGTDDITISGRDRTADLIDSTIGEDININAPTSLFNLTKKILSILNITDIDVIQDESIFAVYDELLTIEPGTTAFDYLQKYAKKSQVLITTNGNGDIVFTRAKDQRLKTLLSTAPDTPARITSRHFKFDNTKRFNKYVLKNQNNDSTGVFFTALQSKSTDDSGSAIDSEIRTSRVLFELSDYSALQDGELADRAAWEANFRRAQSFTYDCTVTGFYAEDDHLLFSPNYLIRVQDEEADINSTLLISEVTYNLSNEDGSLTNLKLVTRDSFTLQVNRPDKDKKDATEGAVYFQPPEATTT